MSHPNVGRAFRLGILIVVVALMMIIGAVIEPVVISSQQRDARVAPPPTGTGEISGFVWSADATPQPMRRVVVSISGGDLPSLRSAITDDGGRFVFGKLSAGTFSITARKPAYLPAAYGSPRPGRPGSSIALAAGQRLAITVTMFKGAVIAGALHDSLGNPVSGVSVSALDARVASETAPVGVLPAQSVVTDDRGLYRIYGLMPGDYMISTSPRAGGQDEIGARSAAEMDTLLSALGQRQKVVAINPAAPSPPFALSPSVAYAPIYFPGTTLLSEAAPIRVAAGEEREGVSFAVNHVRVASITGTVAGDVVNFEAVQLSLIVGGPRSITMMSTQNIASSLPNARGEFKYSNMPPGQYRIVARARRGATESLKPAPGASFSSSGYLSAPTTPNVDHLFAVADVEVRGQDIAGIGLQLQTGGTLAGKVVFDAASAPIPADLSKIRVQLFPPGGTITQQSGMTVAGNSLSGLSSVPLNADGTFRFIGIGPGPYAFSCVLPAELKEVWKLRSAIGEGRDLLDVLVEGPAVQMTGVTLTLSDKRTELSGTLQSAAGQPTTDYYVIAFSADRAHWRPGSRRSLSARPGTDGRFLFADVPAGEYFMAALTDLDPAEWQTAAFLEQVVPAAIRVVVAEGEKKVQDLRIR